MLSGLELRRRGIMATRSHKYELTVYNRTDNISLMSKRNAVVVCCVAVLMLIVGVHLGHELSKYEGYTARQWADEASKKSELAESWYRDEKDMEKEYFDLKDCLGYSLEAI
jgi:hypothetical protein